MKVAAALRSANVTDAELKAAKKAVAIEITDTHINPYAKAELLSYSAMYGYEGLMSEKALLDGISQLTVADVQVCTKSVYKIVIGLPPLYNDPFSFICSSTYLN